MQLGFVSAILPDLSLDEVFAFAAEAGFACVEVMCWPPGKADRRYAGVTHVDCSAFTAADAARVNALAAAHGVKISGLGYYPNPLDPDPAHRAMVSDHIRKVIRAAALLGVPVVNTFIGRDPAKTADANFDAVPAVWGPIVQEAEKLGVKIGIENCPMLYTQDEWPGGKNLASTPEHWRRLFALFPGGTLGLNFDPSHLVWQFLDVGHCVREFGKHFVHVHAKDDKIDAATLRDRGCYGLGWHYPKLPGLGDVNWTEFFCALTDSGYAGPVCIEVEDKAYEGTLAGRKRALRQSRKFLEPYFG